MEALLKEGFHAEIISLASKTLSPTLVEKIIFSLKNGKKTDMKK
jgi:hypothetical protein